MIFLQISTNGNRYTIRMKMLILKEIIAKATQVWSRKNNKNSSSLIKFYFMYKNNIYKKLIIRYKDLLHHIDYIIMPSIEIKSFDDFEATFIE